MCPFGPKWSSISSCSPTAGCVPLYRWTAGAVISPSNKFRMQILRKPISVAWVVHGWAEKSSEIKGEEALGTSSSTFALKRSWPGFLFSRGKITFQAWLDALFQASSMLGTSQHASLSCSLALLVVVKTTSLFSIISAYIDKSDRFKRHYNVATAAAEPSCFYTHNLLIVKWVPFMHVTGFERRMCSLDTHWLHLSQVDYLSVLG